MSFGTVLGLRLQLILILLCSCIVLLPIKRTEHSENLRPLVRKAEWGDSTATTALRGVATSSEACAAEGKARNTERARRSSTDLMYKSSLGTDGGDALVKKGVPTLK